MTDPQSEAKQTYRKQFVVSLLVAAVLVAITFVTTALITKTDKAPDVPGAGAGPTITIIDFAFQPADVTVKPGGTVVWTHGRSAPHTVTFDDGTIDSGVLRSGGTFQHTFAQAGAFTYHCDIHARMTARVVVG